ncbi:hypothetical protein TRAPUB_2951 [Trametes pubescens]|uniref:Uncharacterized protein n=1 Tax=Trametes pubescens TaxID=154538 RepID=A0A1M2VF82_TRAPU|nr:hypothetical protein TRAPUB_2954 [Trametes pubescens]OJT06197.1 hypothetical protein TRAPUB_2951 [Trametes pubescens]
MDPTVRDSPSQGGRTTSAARGSRSTEDRGPRVPPSNTHGTADPSSANSGTSSQEGGSGSQSFTTAYSDSDHTVRGGSNSAQGRHEVINPSAGPRRPATNTRGSGTDTTPPSPSRRGGVDFDGMVFASSQEGQDRLGRYQTTDDITPPLGDPLNVRTHAVAGQQGHHPAVQQPRPMVPDYGPPHWNPEAVPASISSDPHRHQGWPQPDPSSPFGYPEASGPTTYAESLYGPAVDQGHQDPSSTTMMAPMFEPHALDTAVRVIRQQQNAFQQQMMARKRQLDENTQEIENLAQRGSTVIQRYQDYMAEVHAMQSRVNRIAGDNEHMIKDVERGLVATQSLIMPPAPFSSSTPHPHPRQLMHQPDTTLPSLLPPALPPSSTRPPMRASTAPVANSTPAAAAPPIFPRAEYTEPPPPARETPPHMSRSHSYTGATGPQRRTSETLDQFNSRAEADICSAQRVATALNENVAEAVERVHFARNGRTGNSCADSLVVDGNGSPPITMATSKPKAFRIPQAPSVSRAFPAYPPATHPYTDRDPIVPLSIVGRSNPGAQEVVGHIVDSDGHRDVMLVHLCEIIHFKTGTLAPPLPPGSKHPKIDSPGKYDGTDDHNILYTWLDGYLTWLRSYNICGPDTDRVRINCLRPYLTGKAVDWFIACVDNPSLGYLPTFE